MASEQQKSRLRLLGRASPQGNFHAVAVPEYNLSQTHPAPARTGTTTADRRAQPPARSTSFRYSPLTVLSL